MLAKPLPGSIAHAGRLIELDATRGLAALMVFLGHVCLINSLAPAANAHPPSLNMVLLHLFDGAAAVDYFFVLSGFVLSLPYVNGSRGPLVVSSFIARRVIRIMPTYWAGLLLALIIRTMAMPYVSGPLGNLIDWSQPVSTHQIIAHFGLIFGSLSTVLIDGPVWSLVVEMQLSLLLPLVIATLHPQQSVAGSVTLLILSCYAALAFGRPGTLSFLPLFVLGALIARYQRALTELLQRCNRRTLFTLVPLVCVLFWNRTVYVRPPSADPLQDWISGVAAGFILLYVLAGLYPRRLLNNAVARYLGRISYSLYIVHLPILYATTVVLQSRAIAAALIYPAALVLVLAGSTALYALVENPSIGFGRWLVPRGR